MFKGKLISLMGDGGIWVASHERVRDLVSILNIIKKEESLTHYVLYAKDEDGILAYYRRRFNGKVQCPHGNELRKLDEWMKENAFTLSMIKADGGSKSLRSESRDYLMAHVRSAANETCPAHEGWMSWRIMDTLDGNTISWGAFPPKRK